MKDNEKWQDKIEQYQPPDQRIPNLSKDLKDAKIQLLLGAQLANEEELYSFTNCVVKLQGSCERQAAEFEYYVQQVRKEQLNMLMNGMDIFWQLMMM